MMIIKIQTTIVFLFKFLIKYRYVIVIKKLTSQRNDLVKSIGGCRKKAITLTKSPINSAKTVNIPKNEPSKFASMSSSPLESRFFSAIH